VLINAGWYHSANDYASPVDFEKAAFEEIHNVA